MKNKTYRFAAALAVLLALLVFIAPVGATEDTNKAVVNGNTIEIYGTVQVSSISWPSVNTVTEFTVIGKTNDATLSMSSMTGKYIGLNYYDVTFKDLTIETKNQDENGFAHTAKATYENCTIKGQIYAYAPIALFKNSTFCNNNMNNVKMYNIWTYGSNDITFDNCKFNSDGKTVLVYKHGDSSFTANVKFIDCVFGLTGDVGTTSSGDTVSAIEVDSSLVGSFTISVENSAYDSKYSGLVRHKSGESAKIIIKNTVQYDPNGGSGSIGDKIVEYNFEETETTAKFTFPGNLKLEPTTLPECTFTAPNGKIFEAWEIDGTKYQPGDTHTILKDTTVKAVWKDITYGLSATPTEIGFDSVKVGYTQPTAKEVTVKNNGNVVVTLTEATTDAYIFSNLPVEIPVGGEKTFTIQPKNGLAVGNYAETLKFITADGKANVEIPVSFLVYQPSSGGSTKPVEEPEEPVEPETPVDPETPTEEPVAGETTVETEVTDGGEVELENPTTGGSAAAEEDEAKITGVVLPTGTDSEVTFVPVSEQAAPEGKETQTKKVFEINVPTYEKGKAATIKFTMTVAELAADGKEAADVALWHFDEETGEWTKLVTSYTIVDGVVYFEAITNDFSPFAIIYEDEPADKPVDEPETPASPAPVLGLIAALGAAVVLRRK